MQPGASVAAVADRHGVALGLIYQWLKQLREGRMPGLSLKEPGAAGLRRSRAAGHAAGSPGCTPTRVMTWRRTRPATHSVAT
jgi:transposase-like protein